MNARLVNTAAGVVQAAMEQGRQTATGIAVALDSAQLLMTPEVAAELERLRLRVDEVERAYTFDTAELKRQLESAREQYRAGLRRADEHLREMNAELKRYADGTEGPVLWSVYNRMHLRADQAEGEVKRLTARVAELEAGRPLEGTADEDPIAFALTEAADDVRPQVRKVRALLAGQTAAVEEPHDSPLHHDYRVGRDLPESGGAK